jgi:hypothetical protein
VQPGGQAANPPTRLIGHSPVGLAHGLADGLVDGLTAATRSQSPAARPGDLDPGKHYLPLRSGGGGEFGGLSPLGLQ